MFRRVRTPRPRTAILLTAAVCGAYTGSVDAQTWVGSSGSWSDASKWLMAPPTPSPATVLMFPVTGAGSLAYTSTNDLPGAFTLDEIGVFGNASGSLTISAGAYSSLRFAGATPRINAFSGGNIRIDSRVSNAGTQLLIDLPMNGTLALDRVLSSPTGMYVENIINSTLTLAARNRLGGDVVLADPLSLVLGNVDSLGLARLVAGGNSALSLGTATFATPPNDPPYLRNDIDLTGGLTFAGGRSFTLTGSLSGNGSVGVAPPTLSTGTWTLAGNNSAWTGHVFVNAAPGATQATLNMLVFEDAAALPSTALNSEFTLNGVGAAIGFMGGATPYAVPHRINTAGGSIAVFNRGSTAQVDYQGIIYGPAGLTRVGQGVLRLSATNSFGGGLTLAGDANALTIVESDANLGLAGGTVTLQSGALRLGPAFVASNRTLRAGNGGGILYSDSDVLWSGQITNNGVVPGSFTKAGAGNLIVTNNNTVGSLTISGGSITVSGVNGRLFTPAGSIQVNQSAALVVDSTAAAVARLSNNAAVNLNGGVLRLIGNATVNTSAITTGVLQLGSPLSGAGQGLSTLRLEPGASAHALVRFASLGRGANNGGQILFSGPGLGDAPIASLTLGKSNVQFNTVPTQVSGVMPYAIIDNGAGIDLAAYNATNGVVPATYGSSTINNGTLTNLNVLVGSDTLAGAGTINAAEFTGGTVNLSTGTLVVTSGAMLFTGQTLITGGTLTVGVGTTNTTTAPTANLFVFADTTISSRLITFANNGAGNPSGLAKSGPGVLTLAASGNTYSGPTRILEGTLRLGATNVIPDGSTVILNPGAVLDMNGFNEGVAMIGQVSPILDAGNDGVGTILLGSATLTLSGDATASQAFAHQIIGNGTILKSGAGTLEVYGSQSFNGTMTIGGGTVALGTLYSRGTGFSNVGRFNIGFGTINADSALRIEDGAAAFDRPVFAGAPTGRTATLAFGDAVGIDAAAPITLTNTQGLIVDAAGGVNLSGLIAGTGPITFQTTGIGQRDSRHFSVRVSGANTYTGTTTLAADATVFSHPQSFGAALSALLLGSVDGDDNPELSGDAPISLNRAIVVQGSFSGSVTSATLGSRVPDGGGTLTYAGGINIAGNRSRLILFSNAEPVVFAGAISGGTVTANVQIGARFTDEDVATRGTVILSGTNSYAGGTTLAAGTLGINGNTTLSVPGNTLLNSPIGTGTLTIGLGTLASGHEPTIAAIGSARALYNSVVVTRDFVISGNQTLTFAGAINLGNAPRIITVDPTATAQLSATISGGTLAGMVKHGGGAMYLSAFNLLGGGMVVNDGTLTLTATQRLGGPAHVGPGATMRVAGTGGAVLLSSALSVDAANGGVLDLTDRGAIVDYTDTDPSPLAAVTALIASGYNAGAWTGPGVHSTVAATLGNTAVGIVEADDVALTSFLGQPFTGQALLLRHTLYGDSNLSGNVDLADFARLAGNFNIVGGGWYNGDYNYDGGTGLADFALLAANYNLAVPGPGARQAVPEPGVPGLLLCGLLSIARRRRP